ncbi:hypothetical protein SUGI_1125230 [Cryptomeria japonica]|nr:hypothetical protein SUGI_1125230 [Cryptomeria japonica]
MSGTVANERSLGNRRERNCFKSVKVEGAQVEDSYMSVAGSSCLGLVALLGGYHPTSKERNKQLGSPGGADWLYAFETKSNFEVFWGLHLDPSIFQCTGHCAKT